jgi:hypothetical protein
VAQTYAVALGMSSLSEADRVFNALAEGGAVRTRFERSTNSDKLSQHLRASPGNAR